MGSFLCLLVNNLINCLWWTLIERSERFWVSPPLTPKAQRIGIVPPKFPSKKIFRKYDLQTKVQGMVSEMREVEKPTQGSYMDLTNTTNKWCFILWGSCRRLYAIHLTDVHLRDQNEVIFINLFSFLISQGWLHGFWLHFWFEHKWILVRVSCVSLPQFQGNSRVGSRSYLGWGNIQLCQYEAGQSLYKTIAAAVVGEWDRTKKILKSLWVTQKEPIFFFRFQFYFLLKRQQRQA